MSDILRERRELSPERRGEAIKKFIEDLTDEFVKKQADRNMFKVGDGQDEESIQKGMDFHLKMFLKELPKIQFNLLSEEPLSMSYNASPVEDGVINYDYDKSLVFRIKFCLSFCEEGVFISRIDAIEDSSDISDIALMQGELDHEEIDPESDYGQKLQKISGLRLNELFPMNNLFQEFSSHIDEEEFRGWRGELYAEEKDSTQH
jgi:hypothetical protein